MAVMGQKGVDSPGMDDVLPHGADVKSEQHLHSTDSAPASSLNQGVYNSELPQEDVKFVHRAAQHAPQNYNQSSAGAGSYPQQGSSMSHYPGQNVQQYSSALAGSSNYTSQQQHIPPPKSGEAYADGDASGVHEVANRMNEVRIGGMDYLRTGLPEGQMGIPQMSTEMMRHQAEMIAHDPNVKMHPYMGMYVHGQVPSQMPYVSAQPGHLPFRGMHGGYQMQGRYEMQGNSGGTQSKHNKYCHFCQHVKVRASGMLACCNKDCTRRFCEHCLSKSIGDDVNPQTSNAWESGQWHCPVCRKLCCCAIGECSKNHRHCKAYRYRVRRAEQASKRASNAPSDGQAAEGNEGDNKPATRNATASAAETTQPPAAAKPEATAASVLSIPVAPIPVPPVPMSPQREPMQSPKVELASPSGPNSSGRVAKPQTAGFVNFDFQDAQADPNSWLELFQDEDCAEDPSFLFGEDARTPQARSSVEIARPNQQNPNIPRIASKENFGALPKVGSTDSFSRLLGSPQDGGATMAAWMERGMSNSASSESLAMLHNLSRNVSSESLHGLLPRNYSNSSLTAVMEAAENWTPGMPVKESSLDSLGSKFFNEGEVSKGDEEPSGRPGVKGQRGTNMGPGFSANYETVTDGLEAMQNEEIRTGKRMQRTSSHNCLVRESASAQGMCRPPSYEKLSRACRTDYAAVMENTGMGMGMVGSNSSDDLLRSVLQQPDSSESVPPRS